MPRLPHGLVTSRRPSGSAVLPLRDKPTSRHIRSDKEPSQYSRSRRIWMLLLTTVTVASCCGILFTGTEMLAVSMTEHSSTAEALQQAQQLVAAANASTEGVAAMGLEANATVAMPTIRTVVSSGDGKHSSGDSEELRAKCYAQSDYGILDELKSSGRSYCSPPDVGNATSASRSSYTHFHTGGDKGIRTTLWRGLRLDLSRGQEVHAIHNLSEEGFRHDPRFSFSTVHPLCACDRNSAPQDEVHGRPSVWDRFLVGNQYSPPATEPTRTPKKSTGKYLVCDPPSPNDTPSVTFSAKVHAVLVARKEDHNPFFQLSSTLNAWMAMKAVNWSNQDTQVVYMDRGNPSPIDELRRRMLAPVRPALMIDDVLAQNQQAGDNHTGIVHFEAAMLAPYEATGPLVRHLDDRETCWRSQLIKHFRSAALAAMGVNDEKRIHPEATMTPKCLATIFTRRDYGGRKLQRVWLNEAQILDRMRHDFGDRCEFQSVDFVNVSVAQQMRTALDSDVIIGMHGASMVNMMWTRPGTLLIEIFPKSRRRWGYRNICQHVGCDWHEFRGGEDIPSTVKTRAVGFDPNAFDKSIPPDEWVAFANPLLEAAIARLG